MIWECRGCIGCGGHIGLVIYRACGLSRLGLAGFNSVIWSGVCRWTHNPKHLRKNVYKNIQITVTRNERLLLGLAFAARIQTLSISIHIYIYVCIRIHVHVYIYIYIFICRHIQQ